MTLTYYRYFL